jgi:hypothetical protein
LLISSDDPDESLVYVELCGVGVYVPPTPPEQMQAIMDFFDQAVVDGTIVGRGPCDRAIQLRLKAFRHMLKAAGDLIDGEYYGLACLQLRRILWRCDDRRIPPDFIQGEAVSQLAVMIEELRQTLGCHASE